MASWENKTAPKLPPPERMLVYAQFFATPRSVAGTTPQLVPPDSFDDKEQVAYEALLKELRRLHAAARGTPPDPIVPGRSWYFTDTGPLTLVCAQLPLQETGSLADPADPNYTELLSFGDLDAMVDLWGHVHMENPSMDMFFKSAPNVVADDLTGHVVIIGGIGWNEVTKRILDLTQLPVKQESDLAVKTGEIFTVEISGSERRYYPTYSEADPSKLVQDVGLLVRMPNPLNSNRTLTMCNGIHSRGVLGAVRSLTDKRLRESNERYIARNFRDNQLFGILMRIQVIEGHTMTPDFNTPGTVLYEWSATAINSSSDANSAQAKQ